MEIKIKNWTKDHIPQNNGKLAVITGSTEGLGLECAVTLAAAGWKVIILGRNAEKGTLSIAKILKINPKANVNFKKLDLADFSSIKNFTDDMIKNDEPIDLLINNAGVMTPPKRLETKNGLELQLGTNHIGHFALTAQLLKLLQKSDHPRVVTVSSIANRTGTINFDDLQSENTYIPSVAYSQSKLANLMFAFELQRRSNVNGWGIRSIAAHPGVSRTKLLINGAGSWSVAGIIRSFLPFLFQPIAQGALPILFAATSPVAKGGGYYGPSKMSETRGFPSMAKIPTQALDENVATKLWDISQKLANVEFK